MSDQQQEATRHEWAQVEFSYGAWLECTCGQRAHSDEERLDHERFVEASSRLMKVNDAALRRLAQ